MVIREDRCVGCPPRMCIGRACGQRDVEVMVCDWCGSRLDVEERYTAAGEDLCLSCQIKYDDGEIT